MSAEFRRIKEVELSTPELRAVWWNPVPKKSLPNWKVWAAVAFVAIAALGSEPLIGLLVIAGAVAYIVKTNKDNAVPVEATSLNVLRAEISSAIDKTTGQIGPDLGITENEFRDAQSSKLLLVLSQGTGQIEIQHAPGVYRKIETYVAIITPKGLGYLTSQFDTVAQTHSPGTRELMLWKRVARVRIAGNSLEIEATSGTSTVVPLDQTTRIAMPGFAESITELVNPFVREAQKMLEANA